jgi:hypothetical protein
MSAIAPSWFSFDGDIFAYWNPQYKTFSVDGGSFILASGGIDVVGRPYSAGLGDPGSVFMSGGAGDIGITGGGVSIQAGDGEPGGTVSIFGGSSGSGTGGDVTIRPGAGATFGTLTLGSDAGTCINITANGTTYVPLLSFFTATPIAQPTVSGSRGGNAALTSLITTLANLGLIIDTTTA